MLASGLGYTPGHGYTMKIASSIAKPGDVRLRTWVVYGILFDVVQNLFRPFGSKYLDRLGGDEGLFFLFNSLPALLAALTLIPTLLLVRRLRDEAHATAWFTLMSRVFLLSFIVVPLLPEGIRPGAFLVLFSLMSMPEAASQSGVQSYLGHVFLAHERARAISRRQRYAIPFVLVVTMGTGLVLRYLPGSDADRILLYQLCFALAFVVAIGELVVFLRLKPALSKPVEQVQLRKAIRGIAHNKAFLGFALASLTFHFGWQFGWPLFSVWHIKYLGADEVWLAAFSVVGALVMFFAYGFWERIQKRIGLPAALVVATLGQALNPFFIGAATELWIQALAQIPTAFFTAGVVSTFLSAMLEVTPNDHNRVVYFAVYNTAIYLSQVLSQELSHLLSPLMGIRAAIFLDGGLRLVGVAAFWLYARRLKQDGEGAGNAPPGEPSTEADPGVT